MRRQTTFLLIMLLLSACSDSAVDPREETGSTQNEPPSFVGTEPLNPTPIRVSIDDLPAPFTTPSAVNRAVIDPVPESPRLYVPQGFKVNVYADGLSRPRTLTVAPGGDVFVAESASNRLRVLRDSTGNGVADMKTVFADESDGLVLPFGLVFAGQAVYVAERNVIVRFAYEPGQLHTVDGGQLVANLTSSNAGHWTRDLVLSRDGEHMYVSIGSATNVSTESPPRATVQEMTTSGGAQRTFASGLRNPVGLAVHPVSGDLYVVVNERDGLGDNLVPDFLARLTAGDFYGWPYAYLSPHLLDPRRMKGGESEAPELASTTKTPAVLFQAHSAPLGLVFYDGDSFPLKYKNGAFVALHGSWNRSRGTGYKVVFVPFGPDDRPLGYYEDFLTGFLISEVSPHAWGRPVGLTVLPDGSLLVSDDANGMIYRIQYYR